MCLCIPWQEYHHSQSEAFVICPFFLGHHSSNRVVHPCDHTCSPPAPLGWPAIDPSPPPPQSSALTLTDMPESIIEAGTKSTIPGVRQKIFCQPPHRRVIMDSTAVADSRFKALGSSAGSNNSNTGRNQCDNRQPARSWNSCSGHRNGTSAQHRRRWRSKTNYRR
eukprot:SAG22_NODE_600_length_8677_cov_18.222429_7_plen_165_part_00